MICAVLLLMLVELTPPSSTGCGVQYPSRGCVQKKGVTVETVALVVGLLLGAGAVWFAERYHERRYQQMLNVLGQMQLQVEQLRQEVERLKEPPIPEEEL